MGILVSIGLLTVPSCDYWVLSYASLSLFFSGVSSSIEALCDDEMCREYHDRLLASH